MITKINPYTSCNKNKMSISCCSKPNCSVMFKANPDKFIRNEDNELAEAVSSALKLINTNNNVLEPFASPDPQLVFEKLFLNINKIKDKFNLGVSYIYSDGDGFAPIAARISEEELKKIMTSTNFKPTVIQKLQSASDDILYDVTHRFDD